MNMNNPIIEDEKYPSTHKQQIMKKTLKILTTIDNAYTQIRKHAQIGSLNFINRISLNLEQDKLQILLMNLQKGYLIIKHSESTRQPHQKYLYISQDRRFLCWKSVDKSDEKMIELKNIEFIVQDDDAIKFIKSSTIKNRTGLCFVIVSKSRNLEIQCTTQWESRKIIEQLEQAIKNSKRMHLSYRF